MGPSSKEEEYFLRQEIERRKEIEKEKLARLDEQEKQELMALHHMHCPKCGHTLIEVDYKGIAVDNCSHCHGVWLDAGELEQVSQLEKSKLDKWFHVFNK